MNTIHKIGAALVAALLLFGTGWFARGKEVVEVPKTVIQKQTEVQTKVVDHVVTKVVTKTVKVPSGPTTTTTTTTVTEDKTKDKDSESKLDGVKSVPMATSSAARNDWGLALKWQPRLDPTVYYPTQAEISRRVLGDLWGTIGVDWHNHDVTVGVRYDF